MSHIGQFIDNLVFCNIFIKKSPKTTIMGQKVTITDIRSDLTEKTFFIKHVNRDKYFWKPQNGQHSKSMLFRCFEAFLPEIDKKNLILVIKINISVKKLRITRNELFSQEVWSGSNPVETVLNIKMSHIISS